MEANVASVASLRSSAPTWSLAGDKQLLDALQCLQERIITKCQETNRKLEEMVTALDDASINLHNVNNRFMALSNSQFVESRVYDDDDITTLAAPTKEPPKPVDPSSELDKLKLSLRVLESMHTAVTILRDSDTESDDDDDVANVVLKPKDVYSDRPLPHIIGSQAWKSKWHAGLLPDDSDSDTTASNPLEHEQYSDSEPDVDLSLLHVDRRDTTISTSSSELTSKQEVPHKRVEPSPSDIAAELARRLGGAVQMPAQEPQYSPPNPTTRKVYKPEKPTAGIIFSDEPPPLDESNTDDEYGQEDDIFAELHKNKPYDNGYKGHNVTDELFGSNLFSKSVSNEGDDDIFGVPDVLVNKASTPVAKPKSTLFEDESEPELFAQKPTETTIVKEETITKKPVGGISLFGTNKNADSIGAAILKRNRKSSTSGEESDSEPEPKPQIKQETKQKEKDIFDDLFAKSEKLQKKNVKEKVVRNEIIPEKVTENDKKVDLFSDNLFDDIDDLFSTNIVAKVPIKEPTKNQKSLFDDDDDLFADIAVTKPNNKQTISNKEISNSNTKTQSIFDSDDDLFTEKKVPVKSTKDLVTNSKTETEVTKNSKGLYDSDDDVFSKTKQGTKVITNNGKSSNKNTGLLKDTKIETVISKEKQKQIEHKNTEVSKTQTDSKPVNSPSLFDDDDEIDDLFSKTTKVVNTTKVEQKSRPKDDNDIQKDSERNDLISSNDSFDNEEDGLFSKPTNIKNHDTDSQKPTKISKESNQSDVFEESDIFSKKETISETNVAKELPKIDNVFEDDWEDDLFTNKAGFKSKIEKPSISQKPTPKLKNTEFDSVEDKPNISPKPSPKVIDTEKPKDSEKPNEIKYGSEDIFKAEPIQATIKSESTPDVSKTPAESKKLKNDEIQDDDTENVFNTNSTKLTSASKESHDDNEKPVSTQKPVIPVRKPDSDKPKIKEPEIEHNIFENDNEDIFKSNVSETKPNTAQRSEPEHPKLAEKFVPNKAPKMEQNILENSNFEEELFKSNISKTKTGTTQKPEPEKPKLSEKPKIPNDLFENNDLEDDLFNTNTNKKTKQDNKGSTETTQTKNTESGSNKLDNMKELDANKNVTEVPEADIFSDIFDDQPPIFEKPKERKKSKNVNALFDDDSDDEALFFKKNDLLEDKPSDLSPKVDDRFDLFFDEPPAIDDFDDTDNSKKIDDKLDDSKSQQLDHNQDTFKTDANSIKNTHSIDISKPLNTIDNVNKKVQISTDNVDATAKKVGKLKPMNFNINVNTLLPGASPKKLKNDQISNSHEELHTKEKTEETDSKLVKSVSFEGDPESVVLDNKLSKDRPKIQVRRRPSTRRARREAVKKSGIDFGEDSTDNSSSIDDVPRKGTENLDDKTELDLEKDDDNIEERNDIAKENSDENKFDILKNINIETEIKTNVETEAISNQDIIENDSNLQSISKTSPNRDVKSKIVYILNDEDIFNSKPEETEEDLFKNTISTENQSQGITTLGKVYPETNLETKTDDRSEIFNEELVKSQNIHTKVDNNDVIFNLNEPVSSKASHTKSTKQKNPLFDDSSDEELFGKKTIPTKKQTIFDSDSDNELFGKDVRKETKQEIPTERRKETETVKRKEIAKPSLFSDDDDDDLFGVRTKKVIETKVQPKVKEQATEQVYEDPLSMFGSQDE